MRNLHLIVLIFSSLVLLNGCGEREDTSSNLSPSPKTSTSSTPATGSKAIVDNIFLEDYQKSQNKIVNLLNERANIKNNSKNQSKIEINRQSLIDELQIFHGLINSISIDDINNQKKRDKITQLKEIIIFDSISNPTELEKLQKKLNLKNLGDEKGLYGQQTNTALVGKIEKFGTELKSLATNNSGSTTASLTSTSLTALEKKVVDSEKEIKGLQWTNNLSLLISALSIVLASILIGLTIWTIRWYNKDESSPKNTIAKITNDSNHQRIDPNNIYPSNTEQKLRNELEKQIKTKHDELSYKIHELSLSIRESNRLDNLNKDNYGDNSTPGAHTPTSHSLFLPASASPSASNNWNPIENTSRSPRQRSFVNEYNQDSRNFANRYGVEEVLEKQSNIEGRRSGVVQTVNLNPAPTRRGAYWVFSHENQYMVVPSADAVRIQEHNQEPVNAIFDYSDFNPNYSYIQLIEPAIVTKNTGGYQLFSKGRIEFV
jgi:hypothetical protein